MHNKGAERLNMSNQRYSDRVIRNNEFISVLEKEDWNRKSINYLSSFGVSRHRSLFFDLWLPPIGGGYEFFNQFGLLLYNGSFSWVKIEKKIFKNNSKFNEWNSSDLRKDKCFNGVVLYRNNVYYICEFVTKEFVLDHAKNNSLIDTIIFNFQNLHTSI
jgi:hypothetical protein